MPTALVQGRIAVQYVDLLRNNLDDDWTILVWDPAKNDPAEFPAMAAQAEAIIGGGIPTPAWPAVPNLKMYQIPWTGYDFCSPDTMPADIPVCNTFEHESTIAEWVLAAMLEWKIGVRAIDARFRREGWGGRPPGQSINHSEVRGRTLGIVGYGHIGREVAKRAAAFDMRVIATRRKAEASPPAPLGWIGTADQLRELLGQSDFVLVACDLNAETEGLIGAAEFAAMKDDAFVINVGRGRVISEEPFYEALKNGAIGGAAIDVWYNYIGADGKDVWPCNLPFQDLDNVILSPHESASAPEQVERRWVFVAKNINRAVAGETLENQVFVGRAPTGG